MKLSCLKRVLAMPVLLLTLAGCIEEGYDLTDIDTTSRFMVNDLVIPVNLDAITLKSVIDIDEDSKIQIYTTADGRRYYAVKESGTFTSDPITVDEVVCAGPIIAPNTIQIARLPEISGGAAAMSMSYKIDPSESEFVYDIENIDEAIRSVSSIKVKPMAIVLSLSTPDMGGSVASLTFEDLKIYMPKGLTATASAGAYDRATGLLSIDKLVAQGAEAKVVVTVTAIDMAANGSVLNYESHSLNYGGKMEVRSGTLTVVTTGGELPATSDFTTSYDFADIEATAFSGEIEYNLSGVDVNDVDLSDLPDFLAGEGTDISLVNPQIYLTVNNPVGNDRLDCRTGLTLSAIRNSQVSATYTIDNPYFTIGYEKGEGPYYFCLSPSNPADVLPGYPVNELSHVGFGELSGVLSGDGLPSSLGIRLNDPCIPTQTVADFGLGKDIAGVDGSYEFFAPLALEDGSTIIYTDTEDGWSDENVDAITIEKFEVSATATTDVPLAVKLTAKVLGKDGKPIEAELSSVELPANAKDSPFTIVLGEGQTVTNLDGITFTAHVKADVQTALSPEQNIVLKNLKAKVSGHYTKEL